MKKIIGIVILTLVVFMLVTTCYYDSEEFLYPRINSPCDTASITFNLSVKSILQNNCYGCHSNTTSVFGGNIRLENYADVQTKANDGSLLGSISHTGSFSPMPQGADKIEDCKITVIRKWIEAGAPNN